MEIGRKKLPHGMPPGVVPNPEFEVYFITICCEPRGHNQLALPEVWHAIRETVEVRQAAGDWKVSLMLANAGSSARVDRVSRQEADGESHWKPESMACEDPGH